MVQGHQLFLLAEHNAPASGLSDVAVKATQCPKPMSPADFASDVVDPAYLIKHDASEIGRCRLTLSKPEMKAPMVSALETKIS